MARNNEQFRSLEMFISGAVFGVMLALAVTAYLKVAA